MMGKMNRMNCDMKEPGQNMMARRNSMMDKMDPEMKVDCRSMRRRCKSMMDEDLPSRSSSDDKSKIGDLVYTHKASTSFDEIKDRIEEDGRKVGLSLKHVYPFAENLSDQHEFKINEAASVYELYDAPLAAELPNTQPELNVLMPCRISIYEKSGEVFVAIPNLVAQLDALGAKGELKAKILELYYESMLKMIKAW